MGFGLSSSWSMMSLRSLEQWNLNWWAGNRLFGHFSRSLHCTAHLGLITPCLSNLSVRFTPLSLLCDHSRFCICQCKHASSSVRNQMMPWEHSLPGTWYLPLFSAVLVHHYGGMESWWKEHNSLLQPTFPLTTSQHSKAAFNVFFWWFIHSKQ